MTTPFPRSGSLTPDHTTGDRVREVQAQQGWTDTTLLSLALRYLDTVPNGFVDYCADAAADTADLARDEHGEQDGEQDEQEERDERDDGPLARPVLRPLRHYRWYVDFVNGDLPVLMLAAYAGHPACTTCRGEGWHDITGLCPVACSCTEPLVSVPLPRVVATVRARVQARLRVRRARRSCVPGTDGWSDEPPF